MFLKHNDKETKHSFGPNNIRVKSFVIILFIIALTLIFLPRKKQTENNKPVVYTSFYPIYDLAKTVIGDADIELKMLLPANQDPHMWEPTPRDIEKLSCADILIINGANMEERWLGQVRKSLPNIKILNLSDSVDLITYKGAAALGEFQFMAKLELEAGKIYPLQFGHTHEEFTRISLIKANDTLKDKALIDYAKSVMLDDGTAVKQRETVNVQDSEVYKISMGHISGCIYLQVAETGTYYFVCDRLSETLLSYRFMDPKEEDDMPWDIILSGSTSNLDKITYDPHSWMSTTNAMNYLNSINMALSELYPDHARTFNKNKVKAVTELSFLEHEYKKKFKEAQRKVFVVTHYAYAYLARDFGLDQYPLQGLTSMGNVSLHTLRRAIGFCRANNINTIFYEKGAGLKDAQTIAWEINANLESLISMEYAHSNKDYISIMRQNLELLYQSMK